MRRLRMILVLALCALGVMSGTQALAVAPAPERDVHYNGAANDTENGTVFACPEADRPCKVGALAHGGWCDEQRSGSGETLNLISPTMNEKQMLWLQSKGLMMFDIDYPQMTRTVSAYPMEPRAIERAVVWTYEHAAEYGGDPNSIVLWGSSCGGWVATEAMEFLAEDYPGLLKGLVVWSPPWTNVGPQETPCGLDVSLAPCDGFLAEIQHKETEAGPTVELLGCHAFVDKSYHDCSPEVEREVSPIYHLPAVCPPIMVAWGEVHDIVDKAQGKQLADAAEAHGCPVQREPAHGGHALQYWVGNAGHDEPDGTWVTDGVQEREVLRAFMVAP